LALTAGFVDGAASAGTTPANILGNFVSILDFVVARALAINIDAAISTFHSAVSAAIGEVVALPLADLCNASGDHGLRAGAMTLANTYVDAATNSAAGFVTFTH
jgi:hypothetical protein